MFEVVATATFLKTDGSSARDPYVRSWTGIEKESVIDHLEARMISALGKLNGLASDVVHGNAPKGESTNPCEMRVEVLITEDGVKWQRTLLEYPNMGIEAQETLLGIFNGELSTMPSDMKNKENKGKKGKGK